MAMLVYVCTVLYCIVDMIKIGSCCTFRLCQQLTSILEDPPTQILVGRFIEGPQKLFRWKGSNHKRVEHGWTREYYRLLELLKKKCKVNHFAVTMNYHNEVCDDVPLFSATKYSSKGLMHFTPGEPIQLTPCEPGRQGYDIRRKLQFCLDHWDDICHCFHRGHYILMGEDASHEETFADTMFHYKGSGLFGHAANYGKGITRVEEYFVTEKRDAIHLIKMFHSIYK